MTAARGRKRGVCTKHPQTRLCLPCGRSNDNVKTVVFAVITGTYVCLRLHVLMCTHLHVHVYLCSQVLMSLCSSMCVYTHDHKYTHALFFQLLAVSAYGKLCGQGVWRCIHCCIHSCGSRIAAFTVRRPLQAFKSLCEGLWHLKAVSDRPLCRPLEAFEVLFGIQMLFQAGSLCAGLIFRPLSFSVA